MKYDAKDFGLLANLQYNAATFSAFKNHSFQKEIHKLLIDDDGDFRAWGDFKKEALKVDAKYNKDWLKTEYGHAKASANMARKWNDFDQAKDLYPNLKYKAVNDTRTRASHKEWDALVLPLNHKFWDSHYPPNDWGCRCDAIQTDDEVNDNGLDMNDVQDLPTQFNINSGKDGKVFSDEHPYFKTKEYNQTAKFAKDALLSWQAKDIFGEMAGKFSKMEVKGIGNVSLTDKNFKTILNQSHENGYYRNLLFYDLMNALEDADFIKKTKGENANEFIHYLKLKWMDMDFIFELKEKGGAFSLMGIKDAI